ncbi:hypothetical protein ACIPJ1_03220 [Microbacterium maritypicum]|uniref:hypothetical protein n=1 Tax=Microbacterium maritypicum TaxID=33918 RepID=UPI00382D8CC9
MALSLEEFRSALVDAGSRQGLGIRLSDTEAQQVAADPHAAQSWYAYWQSMNPQTEPAAPAFPAPETTPAAETVPLGGHDFAQTAAFASAPPAYAGTPTTAIPSPGAPVPGRPEKKSRVGLWVALSIVGALLLLAIIVVVVAFTTARHWTKVDAPEKPETFHSEEYETGLYLVADDGVSPCAVDQDWTDCIDAMEAQYAGACAGVELVPAAAMLCEQHRAEIDRMRAEDSEGSVVASLGDFGHLTRTPEVATRQVSNNDYEAAVTHEAVCYLGFLGECD